MNKQVNKESLARMSTLQKGYIDQGDQKNSEAISAVSEKVDGLLMGADFAVAEYVPGSTDYLPKSSLGIGKDILNYFTPVGLYTRRIDGLETEKRFATPLQKNNLFKNIHGQYVPAIHIFEDPIFYSGGNTTYRLIMFSNVYEDASGDGKIYIANYPCTNGLQFEKDLWFDNDGSPNPEGILYPEQKELIVPAGTSVTEGIKLIKEFELKLFRFYGGYIPQGDIRNLLYVKVTEEELSETPAVDKVGNQLVDEDVNPLTLMNTSNASSIIQHGGFVNAGIVFPWEHIVDVDIDHNRIIAPEYEFGLANIIPLYLCDGLQGKSGKAWKGLFTNPTWDGIDLSQWQLPCTAIGCGPITTFEGKGLYPHSSSFICGSLGYFSLNKGITNCQSNAGLLTNGNPFFDSDRNYPRVNDMNQVNNMKYVRNRNFEFTDSSYPYAEGGYFAHNVFITAMELAAGTKFIHAANLFGSGISSNDGCNANNFFTSGGVRFRVKDQGDGTPGPWQYRTFGQNCSPLQYNASGATTDMSNLLTQYYPKEQCMESQMVASMATEMGIAPAVEPNEDNIQDFLFPFYGRSYYYMNVPGFDGLQEGQMNCRVYKYMRHDVQAWMNGEETTFEMEVIYRMSLFMGVNLTGDIWAYYGGGLEMVGTPKEGATAGSIGNQIDIYIEPDQKKWRYITAITTPAGTQFDFEESIGPVPYHHILTATNLGDSYTLTRGSYTPWKTAKASSMAQGECYYQWDNAYWISGTNRVRVRSLFRGRSDYASCSPRRLRATNAASYTSRYISGSAQVLVEFE